MAKSKSLSMKKLYQWAMEYADWKRLPENKHGKSNLAIMADTRAIADFLKMIWEKNSGEKKLL